MARKSNFVIQVDNTLSIDGERLARKLRTVTGKLGVLREWRHHSEFVSRGQRARLKSAKAQRLCRRLFTHDGQPLLLVEAERRRFREA
jgi:hypothetical protein